MVQWFKKIRTTPKTLQVIHVLLKAQSKQQYTEARKGGVGKYGKFTFPAVLIFAFYALRNTPLRTM